LLHSQTARASPGHSPQTVRASLIAACSLPFLAAGAFPFVRNPQIVKLLNDRKKRKQDRSQTIETRITPSTAVQNRKTVARVIARFNSTSSSSLTETFSFN